mmetsp:Transcript_3580/g.10166  ORF Transcript_3580/g.10166 Transcript_3580/m.10166 type:complete len:362 (+) Transcript_3580:96-1181(+)
MPAQIDGLIAAVADDERRRCHRRCCITAAIAAASLLAWPAQALQQPHLCNRRVFGGALTSSLLISIPPTIAGAATGADQQALLIPPPQPVPVPGMGAPLRPLVVADDSWTLPKMSTRLAQSRMATQELAPLVPSLSPFAENDVYYPSSFAGKWEVKATLRRKIYPYGPSFVPSRSLIEGSPRYRSENVGDSTTYQAQFSALGGDDNKIIADRRFNSISTTRAYNQLTPVEDIIWDPKKDPTQLKIQFAAGQMTEDMRPIGPRRAEVYLTARKKEESDGGLTFAASERTRQVTIGAGAVVVSDTETITEYQMKERGADQIQAMQRIATYLTPNPNSREGVLWQQVGGKAVAFFDYDIDLKRI